MNSHNLMKDYVDLTCYPILDPNTSNYDNCIFGKRIIVLPDQHCSGLKTTIPLIEFGLLKMSPADYQTFMFLYYTPIEKWGKKEVKLLKKIIARSDLDEQAIKNINLLFIGDDVGDRGLLDLIILLIFAKLHHAKVNFTIIPSNHGMELICCFENAKDCRDPDGNKIKQGFDIETTMKGKYRISSTNMEKLIQLGIISREEVDELIKNCYLPHLKCVDYSVNKVTQKPTVYTHAPSGDDTLLLLDAQMDEVLENLNLQHELKDFKAHNIKELKDLKSAEAYATLIDGINYKFEIFKKHGLIHKLYTYEIINNQIVGSPFFELVWNRDFAHLKRNKGTIFANGHEEHESTENSYGIDCSIGKSLTQNMGPYLILSSYDFTSQDYRNLLNNNLLDQERIGQLKRVELFKIEIEKSIANDEFVKIINSTSKNPIDFMQYIFDEKLINSHYQFNNLQYLLKDNKEKFMNLFKADDNKYNRLAITRLVSIIKNGQLHILLSVIAYLMKNELYANVQNQILELILKRAWQNKNYLKPAYDYLRIMNEYSKVLPVEVVNVKEIIALFQNDASGKLLYMNCKVNHDNLLGLTKGGYTDYFKITNKFPDNYYEMIWMLKMLNLSGISWDEEQHEGNMHDLLMKRMNYLIEGLLSLSEQENGLTMIKNLASMISDPALPAGCLPDLCNHLKNAPKSYDYLYLYDQLKCVVLESKREITREAAKEFNFIITLLVDKFGEVSLEIPAITKLHNLDSKYFKDASDLLLALTDEYSDLSTEGHKMLGNIIFSNDFYMGIFIKLSRRFAKGDQFTGQTLLDFLQTISAIDDLLKTDNEIRLFVSSLEKLLLQLEVNTNYYVYASIESLMDTLIKNNIWEKFGNSVLELLLDEKFLKHVKSLDPAQLEDDLGVYFFKTLNISLSANDEKINEPPTDNVAMVAQPGSLVHSGSIFTPAAVASAKPAGTVNEKKLAPIPEANAETKQEEIQNPIVKISNV